MHKTGTEHSLANTSRLIFLITTEELTFLLTTKKREGSEVLAIGDVGLSQVDLICFPGCGLLVQFLLQKHLPG